MRAAVTLYWIPRYVVLMPGYTTTRHLADRPATSPATTTAALSEHLQFASSG
ncbi:hypothetical protein ABZ345_45595 [Lentzea sp. NPDC005914]|uniref:hypothetical protein n=1 Tax=Lentzea sp. NPDC005914 TaxID=3154572 RepID=UPI0033E6F286